MAGKDALKPYRRKRDPKKTPEPNGAPARRAAGRPIFVVQKHRARTRMSGNPKNWLLIKMKDTDADPRRNPVENEPDSVLTGRTIEKILEEEGTR
jgi:hypothetical protein